ncbi:FAD/NAD(P)-binding protein [Streptomyces sp. AP-93]|uniref:FAD/NAD(P)-binding protein n=1 Tax=Streptomyces sp. AP-93 TaxID=2929048 RepID=UPI001FAEBC0F|nr:FAD/NAD(P)-binding protein [Streptomyces sp. AP-93]MCJ0875394.1 FAD/NAD(P)-binding protein [Streptomyces sp. AP-93]
MATHHTLPGDDPWTVAVIGSGPRGLGVLERMVLRLAQSPPSVPVVIHLVDEVEVGCGRVWRTDQPAYLLMNTVADEISMFSGSPEPGERSRPGAGPSLAQWWQHHATGFPGPNSYAPRALYGRYLHFVLDSIEASLPDRVTLIRRQQRVTRLRGGGAKGYRLELGDGSCLAAHRVVLATGHAQPSLTGQSLDLREFASRRPHLRYVPAGPAAEMPLDELPGGSAVGIIGLGLTFYDVMAALTVGRGGQFTETTDGELRYRPSGDEPRMFAGSRSSLLMPGRGANHKPLDQVYCPVIFTEQRVELLKAGPRLDFVRDIFPWLRAEMDLVSTLAHNRLDVGLAQRKRFVCAAAIEAKHTCPDIAVLAELHGLVPMPAPDLDTLAQPFGRRTFADQEDFHRSLREVIEADLREANLGNVASPRKAALDVLRDVRWLICALVDFATLTPSSHERDFLGWYAQRSAFLVSGPPRIRLRQAIALIDSGLLTVLGPDTRFTTDATRDSFVGRSDSVEGARVLVETVIDARVPPTDVRLDGSPMMADLYVRGVIQPHRNIWKPPNGPEEGFETGGVAVTHAPYHPLSATGEADWGICVLGIPTEHTRWFMTVGGRRPGFWSQFDQDADDVAKSVLVRTRVTDPVPAHAGQ